MEFVMEGDALAQATALVDRTFCGSAAEGASRYERIGSGEELIPRVLYRFQMAGPLQEACALQIFLDIEGLGAQLWEHEVRVLLRLSASGSIALGRVISGGVMEDEHLAYVITDYSEWNMGAAEACVAMAQDPAAALRHFAFLLEALASLHGNGLLHRRLQPDAIEVLVEGQGIGSVRLARFEMSALVSNIVRGGTLRDGQTGRDNLLSGDARSLVYRAPEYLDALSDDGDSVLAETDRADVYSLGVVASEWFATRLPDGLLDALPNGDRPLGAWGREVHDTVVGAIQNSPMPRILASVLLSMLRLNPQERVSAGEAVGELARHYESLVAAYTPTNTDKPLLVAYMATESRKTLHVWKWIDRDPGTAAGAEELRQFLQSELRGAVLSYSPAGAAGYATGNETALAEARFVLHGRKGAWFCVPFRQQGAFGAAGAFLEQVLLIKYVVDAQRGPQPDEQALQRRIPMVEAVRHDLGPRQMSARVADHPSWTALLESVRVDREKPGAQVMLERACKFFLELQDVEIRARTYAFSREDGRPGCFNLRYDKLRDERRIDKHGPLFASYASNKYQRSKFGDFFADEDPEIGNLQVELFEDLRDSPQWSTRTQARFTQRLDEALIEIKARASDVPQEGWIRVAGDAGSEFTRKRQVEVLPEFFRASELLTQLHDPHTTVDFSYRWKDLDTAGIEGNAGRVIERALSVHPFFALHGPPGAGKTFVATRALVAYLAKEPAARVLISAQSNDALDNLGIRIRRGLQRAGMDPIAIRYASSGRSEEKVKPEMEDILIDRWVADRVRFILARTGRRLDRKVDERPVREILGRWIRHVRNSHLELADRVRRGASIVFATCAASTKQNIGGGSGFGAFDWVIVEEAARAWPTEVAIPLVRGLRWTLIGDYKQLPAYRREEIGRLLQDLKLSEDERLRAHGNDHEGYEAAFDFFGTLFTKRASTSAQKRTLGLGRPLERLDTQFRMSLPIAEVVSKAFYDDKLDTYDKGPRLAGVESPRWLRGRNLVWIDTLQDTSIHDTRWANAGEVAIIDRLLRQISPDPEHLAEGDEDPLAIITPYRAQVELLSGGGVPAEYARCIHTVHEYQGREARIVIASLVRDHDYGPAPHQKLGHVADDRLVNVMISRARRLLVIVGNFRHFRSSGVEFWATVCDAVEANGHIIGCIDAGLSGGGS